MEDLRNFFHQDYYKFEVDYALNFLVLDAIFVNLSKLS